MVVDLSTAQTELAKTGGAPANAILSTLKATTSATSVLGNLGVLDDLTAALNQLIATGPDAGALTAHPQLSAYDKHNGALVGDMVTGCTTCRVPTASSVACRLWAVPTTRPVRVPAAACWWRRR